MEPNHWLMKSEPDVFSIDDLKRLRRSLWDGVRNYQARNFMMKNMKLGDQVLFYHSNAEPPGVAGVARVSGLAVPDPSQFDLESEYYDPKATKEKPIWYCIEVEYQTVFPTLVTLAEIRNHPKLKDMPLLQRGQRLSVQPVSAPQFSLLLEMGKAR